MQFARRRAADACGSDVVARALGRAAAPRLRAARRRGAARRRRRSVDGGARLGRRHGELPLRFEVERLPFADGRFHLRLDLTDERGERIYHSLDDALVFIVYPADDETRRSSGLKETGRWRKSRAAELDRRMSTRTCPDWPDLMEIAPELQFKHYTVAEAQLPADALMQIPRRRALGRRDLLRPRAQRLLRGAHRRAVAEALRQSHWYELREWVAGRPAPGQYLG